MDAEQSQGPAETREPGTPAASIHIEFRAADPGLRASFRQAVMAWLTGIPGGLAGALGTPEQLSVHDCPGEGPVTGVDASWPGVTPTGADRSRLAAAPAAAASDRIVFRSEFGRPLYRDLPPVIPAPELEQHPSGRTPLSDRGMPAVAADRVLAAGRALTRGAGAVGRTVSMRPIPVRPVLSIRVPGWQLRPAPVILAVLSIATAGLAYAAHFQVDAVRNPGPAAAVQPPAAAAVPPPAAPAPVRAGIAVPIAAPAMPGSVSASRRVPDPAPRATATRGVSPTPAPSAAPSPATVVRTVAAPAAVSAPPAPHKGVLTGSLSVRSTPAGAEVSVNGIARGRTPLVIRDLPAGSRVVRLDLEGYRRWSWAVNVTGYAETPLDVTLQPERTLAVKPVALEQR